MRKWLWNVILVMLLVYILPANIVKAAEDKHVIEKYTIGVGEQIQIGNSGGTTTDCFWKSGNQQVADMIGNGKIVGVGKGITTITCTDINGYITRQYTIKVKEAPKSITLSKTKIAEFPGHKIDLKAKVNKGAACNKLIYKSSNKKVATVTSVGIVKTKKTGNTTITVSSYNGIVKKVKVRVKNPKKVVALTFDDGPVQANTSKLLKLLKKYDYHVTFFMLGNRVSGNENLLKKMQKEGHEIGTHSWDHPNLAKMSESNVKNNIQKSRKAIYKACGAYPTVFRPPYGNSNNNVKNVCKKYKMPIIIWNVDVEDWKYRNATTVKNKILNQVHPGAVFVLHDLHATTVTGVKNALPELQKRGYELVTVSELAELKGQKLKAGEKFFGTEK